MRDVRDAYDRWAGTYDTDENRTRDLDAELIRGIAWEGLDVLEIGCGTGKNSAWIAPRCRSLAGLDLSPGMLARARERVPGATFVEADITAAWPVPDASADVVIVDLVLEHVQDPSPVFREAARALRPGGWLRICELHPYRQLRGSGAHFYDGAEQVRVPAFVHGVAELVNAGIGAGLLVRELSEDRAGGDELPRLLTVVFGR